MKANWTIDPRERAYQLNVTKTCNPYDLDMVFKQVQAEIEKQQRLVTYVCSSSTLRQGILRCSLEGSYVYQIPEERLPISAFRNVTERYLKNVSEV